MKLYSFITQNMEAILTEWEAFAATLEPAAVTMSGLALRDHAKGILEAIARDIRTHQNSQEQLEKSQGLAAAESDVNSAASIHGALRHASDFSLLQLSAEFRALRATVLRLWLPHVSAMSSTSIVEMVRFNEAIDQALSESIVTYSASAEHTRDLFLAILGHDLRAPLSTMATAGALLARPGSPEQVEQIGLRVKRSARLMGIMVDDLLGFTRTQLGGGMPIVRHHTDVNEICKAATEDASATHPGSAFTIDTAGDLTGQFDSVRLHQLLANLLVNAAQHGSKEHPVVLFARADTDRLILKVTNFGPVIPPEAMEAIYRPLVQLPSDEETDLGPRTSLGLGLFIAREIAIAHGGTIAVSSSAAGGTRFTVTLPRMSDPAGSETRSTRGHYVG